MKLKLKSLLSCLLSLQRKQKSYSSAAEMLKFSKPYSEKRGESEEEIGKLLREMKEDEKKLSTSSWMFLKTSNSIASRSK